MSFTRKVPAQGIVSFRIDRLVFSCLVFLLAFFVPLSTWAECIDITSPVAGDVWYTGETYNIRWNTTSSSPTVRIYLHKDANAPNDRTPITLSAPNNGSYSWTIPGCCNKEGQYAIAVWTDDCSSYSEYFTLSWPSTALPRTPSSFIATAQSSTGIDLSWNFVSDATDYDVYTCTDSFVGNTTQTSYLVSGLSPETTYSYKVRANNDDGSSDFTACQTATTLSTDPDSYTLSGRTKKADGTAILNATVTFTGLSSVQSISNGAYSQTVPNGWSGEVCASKSGYSFSCVSVPSVTADTSGIDLISEQSKHKISGYTQRYNGRRIPSVTVSFSGESSVTSDANGYYEKYVDHGWSGTISGSKEGYKFDSDSISTVTSDQSGNTVHGDYYPRTGRSASVPIRESSWSSRYSERKRKPCSKYEKNCGDPIDTSNGAQFLEYRLLSVQGLVPITFNLAYNSLVVDQEGIAGKAWSLNYDFAAKIQPADNEAVNVEWAENRTNRFNHDGGGVYSSLDEACLYDKLSKTTITATP